MFEPQQFSLAALLLSGTQEELDIVGALFFARNTSLPFGIPCGPILEVMELQYHRCPGLAYSSLAYSCLQRVRGRAPDARRLTRTFRVLPPSLTVQYRIVDRQTVRQTYRQAYRRTDRQTDRQIEADRHTDRQIDRHTEMNRQADR